MSDLYIIIHIATTCDNTSMNYVSKDSTELIELTWSTIDTSTLEILHQEAILVRPVNTPITPYCLQLYGISWEHVRNANTFKGAIAKFDQYMQTEVISKNKQYCFVSFDISKLKIQLLREARDKSVILPSYLQHPRVFDFPIEYAKWQKRHPEALTYTPSSLSNIITALDVENTPSSNQQSSDPKSKSLMNLYSKLVCQLMKKSVPIEEHPDVFTKPYDLAQDAEIFFSERSKILYLSNLSNDTTQSELESWFTQYGGRPVAFWTLKNLESNENKFKSISGFAIFGSHEEATESLAMNGRTLSDRAIEVEPSSSSILDKASELLIPFPPSKNRPRPGDWTCPSCGFSNFQRRTHCFRCSFPASSAVAIQETMYTKTPRRVNNSQPITPQYNQENNNQHRIQNSNQAQAQTQTQNEGQNPAPSQNQNQSQSQNQNQNQPHPQNLNQSQNQKSFSSVPFRAGDWKCDLCSYHNFAKNLCCLKCGASKPMIKVNNSINSIHSVNSTAAAIAAATASGQPLNLSNGFMGLQQPQPHHYNQQQQQLQSHQQQQQQRQFRNNSVGYSNNSFHKQHQLQQNRSTATPPAVSQILMYNQQTSQSPSSEVFTPNQQRFSPASYNSPNTYPFQNGFNRSNKEVSSSSSQSSFPPFN